MKYAYQIFFSEATLEEGFTALSLADRDQRLIRGRTVERPSGWKLFKSMEGQPIKCWCCGAEADRWIVEKHPNDKVGRPRVNLYATGPNGLVMMTRDHIIPKSLGGVDANENLRPGCTLCNGDRGNDISPEDLAFAKAHPELIDQARIDHGVRTVLKHIRQMHRDADMEIVRTIKPFILMGYL